MLKGDTDPEKRPVRAQDSRTTKGGQFGTLLRKTITDKMTRKTMDSKRTFFLAAQTNHGRIGTDQRQVSQGTPTRTEVKRSTATLIQGMPVAPESRTYRDIGISETGEIRFRK